MSFYIPLPNSEFDLEPYSPIKYRYLEYGHYIIDGRRYHLNSFGDTTPDSSHESDYSWFDFSIDDVPDLFDFFNSVDS